MNLQIRSKRFRFFSILLIFVMACMCGPTALLGSKTPPPMAPIPATEIAQPGELILPDVPATVEAAIPPVISLGDVGQSDVPWLIISTTDGLFAANMDGTDPILLVEKSYYEIDLVRAISSTAHKIAVQTSGQDFYHGLALQIISLPDGKVEKTISLTINETEPGTDASPGDSILEAMRAISEQSSFSWSPDGTQLAFTAALDKPDADVYVYDLNAAEVTRVSEDDGQDFNPTWSPDGKSILFFEADSFGTGAGHAMKGIWLAEADGSRANLLRESTAGGEQLLGWRDNDTAVMTSWNAMNGTDQLRLFNIRTQKQTVLENSSVSGAAVATGIGEDAGSIIYSNDAGLYLLTPRATQPKKISSEKVSSYGYSSSIQWQEDGRIFIVHFEDGNLSTFMADGSQRQDAPYNLSSGSLDVSSFGLIWGWSDIGGEREGVSISYGGVNSTTIYNGPVTTPIWNIDNDLLFIVGEELYKATFNRGYTDSAPVSSIDGNVLDAAWMGFSEALDNKYGP